MKIYGPIRTAVYCVLSILILVFVAELAEEIEVLRYFIGGLMIFYGAEEIVLTAIKSKKHYAIHTLYWDVVEIVIGLTLIVFVETGDIEVTYAVVCVSWAIWSILREVRELGEATEELKENKLILCKVVSVVNLLESLTVISLALTMLIEPGEHHAKIHLYLLAAELFTKVLFPAICCLADRAHEKKRAHATHPEGNAPHEQSAEAEPTHAQSGEIEPLRANPTEIESPRAQSAEAESPHAEPTENGIAPSVPEAGEADGSAEAQTSGTEE